MKRKKSSSGGGANWMDTYGDMVTLLLCFFVLLYSMSTISEENWRALVMMFNPDAVQTQTETPGGEGPDASADAGGVMPEGQPQGEVSMEQAQEEIDAMIEELYQMMTQYVTSEGMEDTISVTKGDGKVYVQFNDAIFFDGESPALRSDAYPILESVSEMLSTAADAIDEVRIIGHTAQANPDRPNNVSRDRTLSSNRATNVVIYIQEHSTVDPARLVSEGVGQWRPVASNETTEGRARNRRVEMIVSGRNLEEELGDNIANYDVVTEETSD